MSLTPTTLQPISLNRRAVILPTLPKPSTITHGLARDKLYPTRRGLQPPLTATNRQRLTCDDCRDRIPFMHRVGVHDPAHNLWISVHIGGGNIAIGADENRNLCCIATREAFEFSASHGFGITNDPAFCSSKGDVHYCRLPRHP